MMAARMSVEATPSSIILAISILADQAPTAIRPEVLPSFAFRCSGVDSSCLFLLSLGPPTLSGSQGSRSAPWGVTQHPLRNRHPFSPR